ncbi:serine/threonine-protein phosphatase 4 regulatory subunit 2 [Halyomorpha halys]|uniref:serine/threonine-protein phosphatase 4 regulatory subunit 2 n=1 Tax=Halyomorpha halys TaxID=286706 RepID=UPI0006D4D818|nr:serine/threonine-protein phosphatase 4 regulatory subunit 2 [Halyomorpha halys]
MDNAEEIMHSLEEFSKLKPKDIPRELEDYLGYVAKTGDPVFKWSIIKCLFREKLLNVITDFYESTLSIELPPCPNVDPFNYERMKANLLEKLDSFNGAPFTVQRISELLTNPWKEYNRADKFMRAIEKNILVVSTREPGRYADNEVDTQQDSSFNGIPGPNDSGIESSFTCNDIADPDSSSHNFDANQESQTTLVTGATSNNITSVSFKENAGDIGDSACSNELGLIRNDEVSQEIIIEEKDTETVICSTINEQQPESVEPQSESAVPIGENKATDLSMDTECSLESSGDSNVSSNEVSDESKEASVEVSKTEAIDCLQVDENKSSTVTESNDSSEHVEIVSNSQDNSTEGSESSASGVFEESRPTECDTSNSLDSETSNSCDAELEVKQPVEQLSSDVECKVDSSEVNEAASTSSYSVSETTKTEESAEASNPSTSTSCEPSEMDVGECQISHVDQSQS